MKIYFSKGFIKQLKKLPKNLRETFEIRLKLFSVDKYHPILNNHQLKGDRKDCQSLNVSGDVRLIFKEDKETGMIVLLEIGDHHQLYGS